MLAGDASSTGGNCIPMRPTPTLQFQPDVQEQSATSFKVLMHVFSVIAPELWSSSFLLRFTGLNIVLFVGTNNMAGEASDGEGVFCGGSGQGSGMGRSGGSQWHMCVPDPIPFPRLPTPWLL